MNTSLTKYNALKKYFINLDNRKDRLDDTIKQVGNDFIRVSAVYGKSLHFKDIDKLFDMRKCNKVYHVNQTKAQASATISQYKVFNLVLADSSIQDNDFVLICEDDNTYVPYFKHKLDQLLTFLDDKQFENAQIVILKYLILDKYFDYLPAFKYLHRKHQHLKQNDIELAKKNDPKTVPVLEYMIDTKEESNIYRNDFYRVMRVSDINKHSWSFNYTDIPIDTTNKLVTNTQRIFTCHYIYPFSASCYLIRKKTIKKIVSKYKKPWWYADDFKQFVPVQDILFASPFLAYDSITANDSSIFSNETEKKDNEFVLSNFWYNTVIRKKHKLRFKTIKMLTTLIKWHYSKSFLKRKISLIFQYILLLRY